MAGSERLKQLKLQRVECCQRRQQTTRRNLQVRPFFHKYRPTRVSSSTLLPPASFFRILSSTRQSWYLYSSLAISCPSSLFSFIIVWMQITHSLRWKEIVLHAWCCSLSLFSFLHGERHRIDPLTSCYSFISTKRTGACIFLLLTTNRSQKENFPPWKLSW